MQGGNFNQNLLGAKKKQFFEVVYRACVAKNIRMPELNFQGCQDEDDNQLAHYHHNLNRICVSERQLEKLNFDDIENTATHEVAHVFEQNHDAGFHDKHQELKIGVWRPPSGTTLITGVKRKLSKRMPRINKDEKTTCNANLCRIKDTLRICDYCAKLFCSDHFAAKMPEDVPFNEKGSKGVISMEDWRTSGHPCPELYEAHKAKIVRDAERYKQALDALCKRQIRMTKSESRNRSYHSKDTPLVRIDWKRIGVVAAIITALILIIVLRNVGL